MTDPVVAADGHTYERAAIEAWLKSHQTSPMTREPLAHKNLVPNVGMYRFDENFLNLISLLFFPHIDTALRTMIRDHQQKCEAVAVAAKENVPAKAIAPTSAPGITVQ